MTASGAPLSPVSFLLRSARVWAERPAVRFEGERRTYAELLGDVERLAGALRALGVEPGDRVAALLPNVPEMLQMHFAVPGSGAVLVPINTRLAPAEIAYILDHAQPRVLVAHESLREAAEAALERAGSPPRALFAGADGEDSPAAALEGAEPLAIAPPEDELALLSINYTSGTTGNPKGVMYAHRGAYLHALGVVAESRLTSSSAYLWTLPMFHCNGWAYTWAVTAMGAEHVCLAAVQPEAIWRELHAGVTHLCAAPTVLIMLAGSPDAKPLDAPVNVFTGGAPPSPALLSRMGGLGLDITHLYGLTETYGPMVICAWQPEWDELPDEEQAALKARQGVGTVVSETLRVVDREMADVPADGETIGEVVMRGNNVMRGYYRDPEATERAFAGGWFHSGDLAVMHPDGYVELRDRAKDIVISGGENISTIEVENALMAHPGVVEAAVVGTPDEKWGEVAKAFVVAGPGGEPSRDELQSFVRERLAGFKVPRRIEFRDELPKTATGKIQKFVLRAEEQGG
jgi:fatty-acyl-CoA synthase